MAGAMTEQEIVDFYNEFSRTYNEAVERDGDFVVFEKIPVWIAEHQRLQFHQQHHQFKQDSGPTSTTDNTTTATTTTNNNNNDGTMQGVFRILDLGCGTGLSSIKYFEREGKPDEPSRKVVGVDVTPKMLEQARKLGKFSQIICQNIEGPNGALMAALFSDPDVADAAAVPESDKFDATQMIGVMEFIKDPLTLFKEINHCLKVGGLFGLTVPQKLSEENEKLIGILTFEKDAIETQFAAAGFGKLVKMETMRGFISMDVTVMYWCYLFQKTHHVS